MGKQDVVTNATRRLSAPSPRDRGDGENRRGPIEIYIPQWDRQQVWKLEDTQQLGS